MRGKTLFILLSIMTAGLFSCKKEAAPIAIEKPLIELAEIGSGNSKIAYAGHDLHLDIPIQAAGKIASIKLQITLAENNYGWDFIKTYTGAYTGQKTAAFHEHIDVPENARAGTYEMLILVTDQAGQTSQKKTEFQVMKDASLPSISGISLKIVSPDMLNISGQINAVNKIDKLVLEVQSSAWTKEFNLADPEIIGRTTYQLNKDIDISGSPVGHYHVNVLVSDQAAKTAAYHYHFDK